MFVFFFKQKTAYVLRISDCSSDVCSSDLLVLSIGGRRYRLWIADCVHNEALAYVVPADDHIAERQAATGALHGWIMACSASVPPGQPGPTERWRLVQRSEEHRLNSSH